MNTYIYVSTIAIWLGVVCVIFGAYLEIRRKRRDRWKPRDLREPKFDPMMVVCAYDTEARRVRRFLATMFQSELLPAHIYVVTPTMNQISGRAVKHVIVMPGVDLDQNIASEGSLRDLLKSRQRTHIEQTWVEL